MTTIEALEIALRTEETSIELYKDMSNKHKEITELATFLLNEEYKHRKLIEDKIVEITKY
ncbi:MAG: hypothetical protein PHT41_06865 [Candidatus Omnitrophica bacterium]|nr:hypothetical protein [Candidatus Omnitrophota bacterium]MDD5237826.1 hypothetical protein [Candidatus Omnitrophota bacterium]